MYWLSRLSLVWCAVVRRSDPVRLLAEPPRAPRRPRTSGRPVLQDRTKSRRFGRLNQSNRPGPSCQGVLAGLPHTTYDGFQTGHPTVSGPGSLLSSLLSGWRPVLG